jgi:hypothetical protein
VATTDIFQTAILLICTVKGKPPTFHVYFIEPRIAFKHYPPGHGTLWCDHEIETILMRGGWFVELKYNTCERCSWELCTSRLH